jgi:hypothetical protein
MKGRGKSEMERTVITSESDEGIKEEVSVHICQFRDKKDTRQSNERVKGKNIVSTFFTYPLPIKTQFSQCSSHLWNVLAKWSLFYQCTGDFRLLRLEVVKRHSQACHLPLQRGQRWESYFKK